MFTLTNNIATYLVDMRDVESTEEEESYYLSKTISNDTSVYDDVLKLMDSGYTVVFKVLCYPSTNQEINCVANHVVRKNKNIFFSPSAYLHANTGAVNNCTFKLYPEDVPLEFRAVREDVKDIKSDIQDAEHQYTGLNDRMDEVEAFISGETPEHVVHSQTYDLFSESFKYPSGRLVIDIRVRPTVDVNTPTGQIFYGEVPITDWPIAFAKKPNVTFSSEPSGTNGWLWGRTPPSETKSPGLYIGRATAVTQQNVVIIYHAEGVWKIDEQ